MYVVIDVKKCCAIGKQAVLTFLKLFLDVIRARPRMRLLPESINSTPPTIDRTPPFESQEQPVV